MNEDTISRQKAIAYLKHRLYETQFNNDTEYPYYEEIADNRIETWMNELPSVQLEQKWILIKSRPMTNEERIEWSEKFGYDLNKEEAMIYTSHLPDDGQEVLVCGRNGQVWIDTFENDPDYGCFFDNEDIEDCVAWMPKPAPPKEDTI